MARADRCLASAGLLLAAGDSASAIDRAYYAMFYAAKAALAATGDETAIAIKTHSSVIAQFGLQIVRMRGLDARFGKSLNYAHDLRLKADYDEIWPQDRDAAEALMPQARTFIEAIHGFIETQIPGPKP
jgi:uncharacterized protein (UPF0332 family)